MIKPRCFGDSRIVSQKIDHAKKGRGLKDAAVAYGDIGNVAQGLDGIEHVFFECLGGREGVSLVLAIKENTAHIAAFDANTSAAGFERQGFVTCLCAEVGRERDDHIIIINKFGLGTGRG